MQFKKQDYDCFDMKTKLVKFRVAFKNESLTL